jgi:replicative DNA helicase
VAERGSLIRKSAIAEESVEDMLSAVAGNAPVERAEVASAVLLAERAVVAAILADNTLYDAVNDVLRPDDFADEACQAVFKVCAEIIEGRIPGTTVAEALTVAVQPGIERLVSVSELSAWVGAAECRIDFVTSRAKVVRASSAERGLGAAVIQAQEILRDDGDIETKSEEIQKLLAGAGEVRTLPVKLLGNAAIEALQELAENAKNGKANIGVTTGFVDLDALTAGLHGGQLIVVAARPGIGKTALAIAMGLAGADAGHHILMASMEMKATELSKRALAIKSGVDSHAIRIGALSEADWEAVVTAAEELQKLPFDIVDLPGINLSALAGLCRRLKREGKLDVLIVDYLQIMTTSSAKGVNREQQIAELSRGLKLIAMTLDIPVVVLSQLNRSVETRTTKKPQLSDLRESGAIEQDADVVMFVHREDAADKNAPSSSVAIIIVEKQRAGSNGEVEVRFERRTTGFYDFDAPPQSALQHLDPLRHAA